MEHTYPTRDFVGYADTPPTIKWPNDAQLAVNFCINFEEGAERCILNGDEASEDRLSDVKVSSRRGERDLNIESSYEYGSKVGYWRLLKAFTDRGLAATVNLVGYAGTQNPIALRAMIDAGFDIQSHGWRWIDASTLSEEEEKADIDQCVAQILDLTGKKPLGYYAGLPSLNTLKLVHQSGSFLYSSDTYSDDTPYWSKDYPGLLMLPYSLDTNDSRFGRAESAYQLGGEFAQYVKDSFDRLYAEGETHTRMLTVGLHARLIGRPGRIGALEDVLDYVTAHRNVWIARRDDIAQFWAEADPHKDRIKENPNGLDDDF